jgi:predicted NUDIX family phosphoesterase/dephospho-CoA kinase
VGSAYLHVAEQVLQRQGRALSAKEIVAFAEADQLFPDTFTGRTPYQTLKSKLSVDIRKNGDRSVFVRTRPGRFYLRRLMSSLDQVYEAPPFRPPKTTERVLVFPSSSLDQLGRFQGIKRHGRRLLASLLRAELETLDRYQAELTDTHKQIITYVMVTQGNRVLAYRRGAFNRTEHFLRGSDCVGFGGHVTALDRNLLGEADQGITQCAIRELREELDIPESDQRRLDSGEGLSVVGLLNDDSSPAGRRHFAVIFRYEVSDDSAWESPTRGEKAITRLRWISPGSRLELNDFEYWSQLCLLTYFRRMARGQPSTRVRRSTPFRPPHVICIVGQIGSGKTEASDLLRDEFGYAIVNSGCILAEILKRPPVTEGKRQEFQVDADKFIKSPTGPNELAAAIVTEIEAAHNPCVVVDGVRQRATFEALRAHADRRVAMLYVHAPPDVAYTLYNMRSGSVRSILEFASVREAPVEAEVPLFIEIADAVIFNWYGRNEYHRTVRAFFRRVSG